MHREIYELEIERPLGISVNEMRDYIKDAVSCWKGQFHPNHRMFYLKPLQKTKIKRKQEGPYMVSAAPKLLAALELALSKDMLTGEVADAARAAIGEARKDWSCTY